MQPEERCELWDLPKTGCYHCKIGSTRGPIKEVLDHSDLVIPAKYPGKCVECSNPFKVGDVIKRTPLGWISECCLSSDEIVIGFL